MTRRPTDLFGLRPGDSLPRSHAAAGVVDKLIAYCLAPDHPVGVHKARLFRRLLGFEQRDAAELAARLVAAVRGGAPIKNVRDNEPFGVLCDVRVAVDGIRERRGCTAVVVTVWELRTPTSPPRLVTAYVDL